MRAAEYLFLLDPSSLGFHATGNEGHPDEQRRKGYRGFTGGSAVKGCLCKWTVSYILYCRQGFSQYLLGTLHRGVFSCWPQCHPACARCLSAFWSTAYISVCVGCRPEFVELLYSSAFQSTADAAAALSNLLISKGFADYIPHIGRHILGWSYLLYHPGV